MKEKLNRIYSLIETGVECKNLDESDIDLLITNIIMLIEEHIRKTQDVTKPKYRRKYD